MWRWFAELRHENGNTTSPQRLARTFHKLPIYKYNLLSITAKLSGDDATKESVHSLPIVLIVFF